MNILILSATASAINYRNALRDREDLKLFFTDISPFASGFYDEKVTYCLIPRSRDHEAYQKALDGLIAKHKIDLLVPTSDHDMEGIAHLRRNGWNPPVKMFDFEPDRLDLYTHKYKVIDRLQSLDQMVPRLYKSPEEYRFPLVIKPTREGGSCISSKMRKNWKIASPKSSRFMVMILSSRNLCRVGEVASLLLSCFTETMARFTEKLFPILRSPS